MTSVDQSHLAFWHLLLRKLKSKVYYIFVIVQVFQRKMVLKRVESRWKNYGMQKYTIEKNNKRESRMVNRNKWNQWSLL